LAGEKILNIDDSPTVQRLIEMILASQGYQVVLASDGEAGIAMAKAEKPEVILVDFVMPKMNGFQVCKALKEDPEFQDTPIILVTSKGDKVGSKFVDVLGITEYFTKPFQPEELLAKIREVIDKRKAAAAQAKMSTSPRRPGASPFPSATPMASAPGFAPPPPATPVYAAAAQASGLENLVREIVSNMLNDFVQNQLPDLIRAELVRGGTAVSPAGPGATPQAGIQGNLASFRIVEVMQMLGLQRQTGRLSIVHQGEEAEIYFREGSVVYATTGTSTTSGIDSLLKKTCRLAEEGLKYVERVAEMTGQPIDSVLAQERLMDLKTFGECLKRHTEAAVYKVMSWRDGDFTFERSSPPAFTTQLQIKVDDLLLEGARRSDEWTLIQQKIPNFSVVFEAMIGNAEELTTRGMSDTDMKVFALIDGRRTVQDIVDLAGLSDFDVAKSMFILLSVNLIRRRK
jgi:CheY-like chemotaxis protein